MAGVKISDECAAWVTERLAEELAGEDREKLVLTHLAQRVAAEAELRFNETVGVEGVRHRARKVAADMPAALNERWAVAEVKLRAVADYMMNCCRDPGQLHDSTRRDILLHIETLKVFENDLRQGGLDEL